MTTMLPAPPKTLGRLGEVLKSSLSSVIGGANSLALPPKRVVCVVMVDGLGAANLSAAAGHASFLNQQSMEKISCFFPATTSTSLTSFATGSSPDQTNFTGYLVFDRKTKQSMNLLSGWADYESGTDFQQVTTISEQATSAGKEFHVVAPASYERSGFTGATMRGAKYVSANHLNERFAETKELLRKSSGLIYLYIPELDQTAHAFGVSSDKWLNLLELVDAEIRGLVSGLPKDAGVIVTADHGLVDVTEDNHIYLDENCEPGEFEFVGGDTRGLQLYLADPTRIEEITLKLKSSLADSCYVVSPMELAESGWWRLPAEDRYLPDLLVLARKQVALYHRDFAKKKSLLMKGHHGSITDSETGIPLIKFNL